MLFTASAMAAGDGREANKAYEEGRYEEAEQLYKEALKEEPENAKLYFNLGNAQARQQKVEEAIQSYMDYRALAESPADKALAEYNIGTLLAGGAKWKPAATHFKNALKLNPEDREAKHNYELALAKLQDEEQQKNKEEQENQPPPEPSPYAIAMKKQAEKLVSLRKYTEAYDLMQQALKDDDTVRAFNGFIERIKNVAEIDEN